MGTKVSITAKSAKKSSKKLTARPARKVSRGNFTKQSAAKGKLHIVAKSTVSKKAVESKTRYPKVDKEALILGHRENGRKLARSLLRRWRVRMPSEEIDSIVDMTLCEAAARYSPKHGASFMTFLFYHLRGNLVRAVASAAKSNHFMVSYARNAGIDVGDIGLAGEQGGRSFAADYSMFEQQDVDLPEQALLKQEKLEICQRACAQLDSLEQEILVRSFVNDEPLIDVARALGYSRCHISRVKKRALDRLKEILTPFYHGDSADMASVTEQVSYQGEGYQSELEISDGVEAPSEHRGSNVVVLAEQLEVIKHRRTRSRRKPAFAQFVEEILPKMAAAGGS